MDNDLLQEKLDQIYKVIKSLKEKHSKKKILWLMKISEREFGLIEALVENFLDNTDQVKYASKILMILRKLLEYVPDIVYDQLMECKLLPIAIEKYIKATSLDDLTPDAFLLLTEFFQEAAFKEILEDREFVDRLMEALTIINKAEYFDAVWNILLVRFQAFCTTKDANDKIETETQYFLDKLTTHRAGRMFIETIIHLLNRKGSEADRTITCLTHIITYERTYDKIFSNDITLLIDIIEDVIDKDMKNEQREALIYLLYQIVLKGDTGHRADTLKSILKNLNDDPDTLTETAQDYVHRILQSMDRTEN